MHNRTSDELSELHHAIINNDKILVRQLTSRDPSLLNQTNSKGLNPLATAVSIGSEKMVKELLKFSASIHHSGIHSAIIYAIKYQHIDLLHRLLSGATPELLDHQDILGFTALMEATAINNQEIVDLLLTKKANPNLQNTYGGTALTLAVFKCDKPVIELLLAAKANLETQMITNTTALDEAITNKNISGIKLLLQYGAVIHDPRSLYNTLRQGDQRNPEVLASLYELCLQLKIPKNNNCPDNEQYLRKEIEIYYSKLVKLTNIEKQKIILATKSPLKHMKFFKAQDIDTVLEKEKQDAETEINQKPRPPCCVCM